MSLKPKVICNERFEFKRLTIALEASLNGLLGSRTARRYCQLKCKQPQGIVALLKDHIGLSKQLHHDSEMSLKFATSVGLETIFLHAS